MLKVRDNIPILSSWAERPNIIDFANANTVQIKLNLLLFLLADIT